MKVRRRPEPAYRALRLRLGIFALALWLAAMSILTWAVAADMQHQLKADAQELVTYYSLYDWNSADDKPISHQLATRLGMAYGHIYFDKLLPFVLPHKEGISSDDSLWGRWDLYHGFEAAELFRDSNTPEQILLKTDSTVTFVWFSESSWKSSADADGYGYIYPPEETKTILMDYPVFTQGSLLFDVLRMKGHFVADRFIPSSIDSGRVTYDSYDRNQKDLNKLKALDSRGAIAWHNNYRAAEEAADAITIYCVDVASYFSPLQPITVNGQQYTDIAEAYLCGAFEESDDLLCTKLIVGGSTTQNGQRYAYTLLLRAWPLQYAVTRLRPTYLVSLLLLLVCVLLLRWRIRRSLTTPLTQLTQYDLADVEHAWEEPRILQEMLTQLRQSLAERNTQLQQAQTALTYAQGAEENRRALVSAIAHELKTPLAVIHSYAEALQLGIAPERQAHYISVIQDQSQKMDAMVLGMLELSRLEAGKVQLASDRVSLLQLTNRVEKALAPLAETKEISFAYPLAEEVVLVADEARLEQVLTNLMGNAIKYAPPGSTVTVKVFRDGSNARFKIQNPSPHLPDEALEKVWDTFYRADPSRTEPGTGLGLALVKTIVELHRGKCTVRNVQLPEGEALPTGVEFGFHIPIS